MGANAADRHVGTLEPVGGRARHTRRWKAVGLPLVACAAVLLASCGSSSSDSAKPTTTTRPKPTTTTTAPAPVLDQPSLEAAQLTVEDLPSGWKKEPAATDGEDGGLPGKICPAGDSMLKNDKHPMVTVEFSESDAGPYMTQALGSAADASAHYADVTNAFDTCIGETWPQEIDGSKVTVTLKAADKVGTAARSGDILTCHRIVQQSLPLQLHPLVGGLPPEIAWPYLRTVTDRVMPDV